MANIKTYQIVINGIEQSISAVDALNKQLDALEKKIDALQGKAVNAASTSSGGGSRTAELSDEDKLLKQIEATQSRINQADMADYKVLLDKKQELKELVTEQKSMTAEARLTEGAYANTMQGMKQHLADIKAAMQTVDLGDTDTFKKLTKDANELNQKLLEIEKSYGQFGRNVGNYPSAAEGFKGLKIQVGDTVAEFVNARQALRALKQEMQTLSTKKDMGIISEEEAERLKSLIPTVKQLESSIQDAGKPMDALMDTMQSIVALAQAGKGLAAFFGLEDTGIEKSIQDLVALQNAMQGLQTIQKQMQAGDGMFKWINMGNQSIDNFINKLFGLKKATTEVTTATKEQAAATSQVSTASKAATTSAVAQTTATAGLTVGMKAATVAAKVLGFALKAIGIGIITAGLAVTIEAVKDLAKSLFSESEAAKKAREEAEKLKQKIEEQRKSFIDASAQYYNAASRISHLRSEYMKTNDQLRKTSILKEASKEFKNLGISIKGVSDAETVLVKQGHDVIELLRLQGNAAAISAMRMEAYKNSFKILLEDGYDAYAASVIASGAEKVREYDEILDKLQDRTATLQENLKIDTKVFDENKGRNNKTLEAVKKAQENINELTLKLMSEGLYKELKKLDEKNRKEIDKIKKNGEKVEEQLRLQYKVYEKEQNELFDKYINDIEKRNASLSLQNEIDEVKVLKEQWENLHLVMNRPTSTKDSPLYGLSNTQDDVKKLIEQYESWAQLYDIRNDELSKQNWEGYFEALKKDYLPKAAKEIQDEFNRLLEAESPEQAYNYLKKEFENETSELKYFLTKYQGTIKIGENEISQILEDSYLERISLTTERFRNFIDVENNYINESLRLEKERIDSEEKLEKDANEKRLENAREGFEKLINESKKYSGYTPTSVAELLRGKEEKDLSDEEKNLQKFVKLIDEYEKEATQITTKYTNQRKAAELDANIQRQNNNYRYYEQSIDNLEDYIQKASSIVDKQPEINKLGFINLKKTREQYKEVLDMYKHMSKDIEYTIVELIQEVNAGKISGEQFETAMNNLEFYKKKLEENVKDINEKIKQHFQEFLSTINEWLQQVGQAANSIMSSLSEITSNKYEEMIDQQQKYIDEYEKLLDKQKDKTQEYADAVSEIENELSNARGDRRQQLIDNLNAEMAAQRASLAQEKKIEKEKEKAEEKRKELEQDKAEAEKRMQLWQARINAAMAVSMAAVNHWPVPAIPMMALAAAVGAAQIAAVASKPIPKYGDGGVIVGRSHKEGGVPAIVGNGYPVELEGQEYIIRKKTATQNIGLLDFVNKSEKKLRLEDFIDFYGSNSQVQKNVTSVRRRFENGGVIPQLRTDISFNDRLITAFEDYSNRPTVVAVTDIINQSARLKEVQVISGLID